jgi:hypothetical protein
VVRFGGLSRSPTGYQDIKPRTKNWPDTASLVQPTVGFAQLEAVLPRKAQTVA